MDGMGWGNHAFGNGMGGTEDDVETSKIHPRNHAWHPWEEQVVLPQDPVPPLECARVDIGVIEGAEGPFPRDGREDWCGWPNSMELRNDMLCPSPECGEPIGDERDPRRAHITILASIVPPGATSFVAWQCERLTSGGGLY
jgi:hypothetical protein